MKVRIDLRANLDKQTRKEVERLLKDEQMRFLDIAVKLCMFVLRMEFGYGAVRLQRLFEKVNQYAVELPERYGDCWLAKVETELEKGGVRLD